jgi:uncharacterized OsmC-like protein
MNKDELRAMQAPLKNKYKEDPNSAFVTLTARSRLSADGIACKVETGKALVSAGLHPVTGGDGSFVCSGDMLLEALVACAGVTMKAVSTALDIPLRDATVVAEGDWDARGTLGVAKDAPVGLANIRLKFEIESDAPEEQLAKMVELTERYCVVLQTLRGPTTVTTSHTRK